MKLPTRLAMSPVRALLLAGLCLLALAAAPVFAVTTGRRTAILAGVRALPEDQRKVVALRFYGDLSLEEIAEVTNRPVGTVKSRLHRGIAALRDHMNARPSP